MKITKLRNSSQPAHVKKLVTLSSRTKWTNKEIERFDEGVKRFGRDFTKLEKWIGTKTR